MLSRNRILGIALFAAMLAALTAEALVLWPGIMLPDAIEQYGEALSGHYDDWHPPIVAWIWHVLVPIHRGPAPMLLLQLGFYWAGYALLSAAALRHGRRREAVALGLCGLLPIPFGLMASILKDCLLAGACLAAVGLLAWSQAGGRRAWRFPAMLLLLLAAATRFNAFLAAVPLFVALLPERWRRTPARLALLSAIAALPLLLSGPITARLLDANRSRVELSMLLFDLGGISALSGADMLPPMMADQMAINRRCYSSLMWDTYSDPCPITFERFRDGAEAAHESPYALWAGGVLQHPVAYAAHRLSHFNRNIRWLVPEDLAGATFIHSDTNEWGYRIVPSYAAFHIYKRALWTSCTPLGWPCVWLALAGAALILSPRLPSRRLAVPLAASALLYGGGYLVLSVASDLRYHLWTMIAALVACVLAGADLRRGASVGRGRAIAAATLVALVLVPAMAWRLFDLQVPGGEQPATPKPRPALTSPTDN